MVAETALRKSLLEHLEAALAISDELGEATVGYMVERALDDIRERDVRRQGR
jgi:hypothetical protein